MNTGNRRLVAAIFTLICLGAAGCQSLSQSRLAASEQVDRRYQGEADFRTWFAFYYREPRPAELGAALRYMDANRYLAEYPDIASVFVAAVMREHPAALAKWTSDWHDLSPSAWNVVVLSLWLSQTREGRVLAQTYLPKVAPNERARFAKVLGRDPATSDILSAEVKTPRHINMLWAGFSATGDRRYVERIIGFVHLYGTEGNQSDAALGEAAIMTLATNSMQHEAVVRACNEANNKHPDARTRKLLGAMLTAVAQMLTEGQESLPAH